jgi:hypothetical protein
MKDKILKFGALITGALYASNASSSYDGDVNTTKESDPFSSVQVGAMNFNIPQYLAAHSSHSSHSSHRSSSSSSSGHASHSSHRSSSSSSSSKSSTSSTIRRSDPLGSPSTPSGTYKSPSSKSADLENTITDKDRLKKLIMNVQFKLKLEGYFEYTIDGIMGPNTRKSINSYRRSRGLTAHNKLDVVTLNALGILVY